MPLDLSILKLDEYEIVETVGINPVKYTARYIGKIKCPFCKGEDLRKKDKYIRKVNHETIGLRRTILYLEARKFFCQDCKRYFNQRFPGILKYKRSTIGNPCIFEGDRISSLRSVSSGDAFQGAHRLVR